MIIADEASCECDSTPGRLLTTRHLHQPYFVNLPSSRCDSDYIFWSDSLQCEDPHNLKDNVWNEEECNKIAELVPLQSERLLEAKDSCITQVGSVDVVEEDKYESCREKVDIEFATSSFLFGGVDVYRGRFAIHNNNCVRLTAVDAILFIVK